MMKNYSTLVWLPAFMLLFTVSCKKEGGVPDNADTSVATFSCKVNGVDWNSDPGSKEVLFWGRKRPSFKIMAYDNALFILAIRSTTSDTQAINIEFKPTNAYVGIYHLYGDKMYDEGYFYRNNNMNVDLTTDFAQFSTIEISRYDAGARKIWGTFEIRMKRRYAPFDEVNVTEGVFENARIED